MIFRVTISICLLGSAIFAAIFLLSSPIQPACVPAAADKFSATCSGGVITQNGTIGYGGVFDNVSVNALSDAMVLGPVDALPNDWVQFYAAADAGLENDGSSYVAGRAGAQIRF